MTINEEVLEALIHDPEKAASLANLIYVSENDLPIYRKRHGKGFIYKKNETKISNAKQIERFKKLVIPPAWKNVRISHLENSHLQVIGLDDKDRKQYRYHPTWSELRNQTKFFKMTAFGNSLPKIRKTVEKDLEEKELNQKKVLALIIRLMEETHIRIGNSYYAKQNKTYGLSTLRSKHVKISKKKVKFEFVGKKGKEHSVTLKNKKLIDLVNQCEEIPGWELFKYYDETGQKQCIDSGMINRYIQQINGDIFSAKDFRTWAASKIYFETLYDLGYTEEEKENKKRILQALDKTAEGLGNTRSVCRDYYVHPHITESFENGNIVPYFKKIKEEKSKHYSSLSNSEKVLLELISDYEISDI